jgi:hypothetical protein
MKMRFPLFEEASEGSDLGGSESTAQTAPDNSKVESEARHFGWVPKEEFRGSEESWVDADSFVKRGKEINPILRKNNERLLAELDKQKAQMAELRSATEEFKKFQQDTFIRKEVELKAQIETLKQQKKTAIREGDGDLAVDLDDAIDSLKESLVEQKKEVVTPDPVVQEQPAEVTEWVVKNKWYSSDEKMRVATDAVATQLSKSQPWLRGKDFLDALDKELEETFTSEKLGRKPKARSPVEGTTNGGNRSPSNKKSYENLPADAKAACDKFVRQKLMTKEQYVGSYSWD